MDDTENGYGDDSLIIETERKVNEGPEHVSLTSDIEKKIEKGCGHNPLTIDVERKTEEGPEYDSLTSDAEKKIEEGFGHNLLIIDTDRKTEEGPEHDSLSSDAENKNEKVCENNSLIIDTERKTEGPEHDSLTADVEKKIEKVLEDNSLIIDTERNAEEGPEHNSLTCDGEKKIEKGFGRNSLIIDTEGKTEGGPEHDLLTSDAEKKIEKEFEDNSLVIDIERKTKEEVDTIPLPSTITDQEEIFIPNTITNEDPSIYGKWLIFTNGNLELQDCIWIQLQNLLKNGDLMLIGSSTAKKCDDRGPFQGVIKCYTCKDINIIKNTGLAIQNILKDNTILDYKTNQASKDNLFRANGNRFITKFMLTANGKLYKRDKLCRWKQISDAEYHNYTFDEDYSVNLACHVYSPNKRRRLESESDLLPSQETRKKKKRYDYPNNVHLNNYSGLWCLFCSIADTDDNGLTELDRAWKEAKILCKEGLFKSVTCETYAYRHLSQNDLLRRTVMCELNDYLDTDRVIKSADKLRERISYNIPMYFKIFCYNEHGRFQYQLKYLYTDDRELYEYVEDKWKLLTVA